MLEREVAWTRLGVRVTRGLNHGDSSEAGKYALRVGERGPLRLIIVQCVPRVVRNGAHLQMFRHVVDTDCRDIPPRMLCTL